MWPQKPFVDPDKDKVGLDLSEEERYSLMKQYLKENYPNYTDEKMNGNPDYDDSEEGVYNYNEAFFEMVDDLREKYISSKEDETWANSIVEDYMSKETKARGGKLDAGYLDFAKKVGLFGLKWPQKPFVDPDKDKVGLDLSLEASHTGGFVANAAKETKARGGKLRNVFATGKMENGGVMDTPEYRELDAQYRELIAESKKNPSSILQHRIKRVQDRKKRLVFGEGVKLSGHNYGRGGNLVNWNEELKNAYVGKVISGSHFLSQDEAKNVGWDDNGQDSCLVMEFTDGTLCFPSRDDEGNGPGFLWLSVPHLPFAGVITEASYVDHRGEKYIQFTVRRSLPKQETPLIIRVLQDPEGNGPGALFGQGIEDFPVLQ
jgi:hypothetical protein